jgi:cyanate permease
MSFDFLLLAQKELNPSAVPVVVGAYGSMLFCVVTFLAAALLPLIAMMAGMWKVFEKAGQPGWQAVVPFYNLYILNEIAGKDVMWFIMTMIPCVQFVAMIVICVEVAKKFGKGPEFGVGLALLGFVFFPVLGFSDARFRPMRY